MSAWIVAVKATAYYIDDVEWFDSEDRAREILSERKALSPELDHFMAYVGEIEGGWETVTLTDSRITLSPE